MTMIGPSVAAPMAAAMAPTPTVRREHATARRRRPPRRPGCEGADAVASVMIDRVYAGCRAVAACGVIGASQPTAERRLTSSDGDRDRARQHDRRRDRRAHQAAHAVRVVGAVARSTRSRSPAPRACYFWTPEGKRYLDFNSQLMCMNIGHGHPKVIEAIKRQAETLAYANPFMATEPRARLGAKLAEITPGDIDTFFFTNGGAEANENAIKLARFVTGRHKILARYRSYHGGTAGAISLTGDPRRWAAEPGIPGVVRVLDPYHGIQRGWDSAGRGARATSRRRSSSRGRTRSPRSSSRRSSARTASSSRPTATCRASASSATATAS